MARLVAALIVLAVLVGSPPAAARSAKVAQATPAPQGPSVTASGAVLWDPADGRVLWGKDEQVGRPPASTTKIMTVLLALEAGTVDDTLTVSAEAVRTGETPGAATLGLQTGQRIAMRSLLAGLVLRSGNDAAVAVAEHVAGSETAFVDQMNRRASELGMTDTQFLNSTGLTDDPGHHASPLDLARLAEEALRNDDFARWSASASLTLPGLGSLVSRNELLGQYPGATGVKTGFTNLAGLCLVASARRDGRRLISVVLGSDASFADSRRILDHGFDDYRRAQPVRPGRPAVTYRWADAAVPLVPQRRIGRTMPADQEATWRAVLDPTAALPVEQGQPLGTAELLINGEVADSAPLVAQAAVGPEPVPTGARGLGSAVQETLRAFARLHHADRPA